MAKSKSARSRRKTTKKAAPKRAKLSRKKAAKRPAPARKASARRKAPARKKNKTKASARRKAPAMQPRRKKAPGRKPAAPKARGKSPVRKKKPARNVAKPVAKAAKATRRAPKAVKASRKAAIVEAARRTPALDRERRRLAETDEGGPTSPSSLGYEGGSSAARSGRTELRESLTQHTETSPALTGGDIDADWEDAYAVGDEAPGGDNPTPDQDRVDDIGKALGVQYNDNEELKGSDKVAGRDKHRWELDPASSDDYRERGRDDED